MQPVVVGVWMYVCVCCCERGCILRWARWLFYGDGAEKLMCKIILETPVYTVTVYGYYMCWKCDTSLCWRWIKHSLQPKLWCATAFDAVEVCFYYLQKSNNNLDVTMSIALRIQSHSNALWTRHLARHIQMICMLMKYFRRNCIVTGKSVQI